MFNNLLEKKTKLSVIGLGYVGLPIALEFARKLSVIGFDINKTRIKMMQNREDPSQELSKEEFDNRDINFTSNVLDLSAASFHIVAVPTPVDSHNIPDLTPLIKASESLGEVLKKGDYVVYESTVYPGATEEVCVPVLEEKSGLKMGEDFKVGYSPERINPGDKEHSLTNIVKVVSGCDQESLEVISEVYKIIIQAGVHQAPTIKVAEAAKIIENTQRDVNIALMNELAMIFNKMNVNTRDVLEAAGTKWNFLNFYPGLVGGHCIGVDPYYLSYKAQEYNYHPQIIEAGRSINDGMGRYIAGELIKRLVKLGKNILESRVLIMGVTFKENVSDIRNSKVIDIINELCTFNLQIDLVDPYASPEEFKEEYNFDLLNKHQDNYDAVVVAVKHKEYLDLDEEYFQKISSDQAVLVDIGAIYKDKIKEMDYFSL